MNKGIQLWPGEAMRTFFRRHIARETALDAAQTDKLAEALTKATNRLLAWEMPAEPEAARPAVAPTPAPAKAGDKKGDKGKSAKGDGATPVKPVKADAASEQPAPTNDKPFDPYAFSAMVVLAKQGREGLAKRLTEIKSLDHLKRFADAQHLGIDHSLSKIDDVRKAILAAAEQRLADRRAAAS